NVTGVQTCALPIYADDPQGVVRIDSDVLIRDGVQVHGRAHLDRDCELEDGVVVEGGDGSAAYVQPETQGALDLGDLSSAPRPEERGRTYIGESSIIGTRSHISSGAEVGGSTVIEEDVQIGYSAKTGSRVTIGAGSGIGDRAEIGPGTIIRERAGIADDSHLGSRVTVGDGATVSGEIADGRVIH